MAKKKKKLSNRWQGSIIISISILVAIIFLPMSYRLVFADMELGAMKKDCELKMYKIKDGSPLGQAFLTDEEGVVEDVHSYSETEVNTECFKLMYHGDDYKTKYILFGKGNANPGTSILEGFFVILIIGFIMMGVFVLFNKLKGEEDEDDEEDYEREERVYY